MTQELTAPKKEPFKETLSSIISPFAKGQKDLFILLARGVDIKDAMDLIGKKYNTAQCWASDDSHFLQVRDLLIDNWESYAQEAERLFTHRLAWIEEGLMLVAEKIHKWDFLDNKERKLILNAYELMKRLHPHIGADGRPQNYDELILKRHREV